MFSFFIFLFLPFISYSSDATTGLLIKLCTGDYDALLPHSLPHLLAPSSISSSSNPLIRNKAVENGYNKNYNYERDNINWIGSREGEEREERGSKGSKESKGITGFTGNKAKHVFKEGSVPVPVEELISLFHDYEDNLIVLLESISLAFDGKTSEKIGNTTLELYLDRYDYVRTDLESMCIINKNGSGGDNDGNDGDGSGGENDRDNDYKRKSKNDYDSDNSDNNNNNDSNNSNSDSKRNTDYKEIQRQRHLTLTILENKVMLLLDGESKYDRSHASLLCNSFRFRKGELYLLDR